MKTRTHDELDLDTPLDRSGDLRSDPLLGQRIDAHAAEVRALLAMMDRRPVQARPLQVAA